MTVKSGVVRAGFSVVRLQSGVDRIRDAFPDGPELLVACDDGTEVVVTFNPLPRLNPLVSKTGPWSKLESDPLAENFRRDGPSPQHEVTLSNLKLQPMDKVEVEGQLLEKPKGFAALSADKIGQEKQHLLASKLTKLIGEQKKREPPVPKRVGAPLFVILPLAAFALWRAYLSYSHGAPLEKSITDIASLFVFGLAFVIRRTRGVRFFAKSLELQTRSSAGRAPRRNWGFMNWTFSPDNQAFLVVGPALALGFAMMAEQTGTKDFPAQGPWPIAFCFFLTSLFIYWTEYSSRSAARIMLKAPPLTAADSDGKWGSVTGKIQVKNPIKALGVESIAVYSNLQKFVKSGSIGTHISGGFSEIDRGELGFAQFQIESEGGAHWSVDPTTSVWASGGRVTPNSYTGADNDYSLSFAEVIPANSRAMIVGRADKGSFKTQDLDGLYIFPAPPDGDPRAAIHSYLRWNLLACLLPLFAILVTYQAPLIELAKQQLAVWMR